MLFQDLVFYFEGEKKKKIKFKKIQNENKEMNLACQKKRGELMRIFFHDPDLAAPVSPIKTPET